MHYNLVPGINYSFRPSAAPHGTTPQSHFEHGLYAYVNADKSPELKKQADATFGKTVPFSGSADNAMLLGRALMSHTGYRQDPLRYMKEKKMPLPPNWSGENHELYTLIGQDFIKRSQEKYNNSAEVAKAKQMLQQKNTQDLHKNLTDLLQNHPGVIENAILKAEDITDFNSWSEISSRLPQMDKRQLATSMQKASLAYNLIKDHHRSYISRRDMAYLLHFLGDWKTENGERIYEQDEIATTFFQAALASKSQRAAKDAGFFDSALSGILTAPVGVGQLLDEGLKIYDWVQQDDSQLGKDAITLRDSDRYRHLMAGIQNTINQANAATTTPGKDASLWQKIRVGLGSATGETIHFFSGGLGAANFLIGKTNLERINAEVQGAENPWLEGAIKTGAQFAAEKIAFGAVGKFAASSRVVDWAVRKFGISKVTPALISRIQANAISRGIFNVGAGTLEELTLEPAMEQIYNGGVRSTLRALGVNVEQYTYRDEEGRPVTDNPFWGAALSAWDSITDPEQVLSTGIFVAALTAGQKAEVYRQAANITKDVDKLVGMGIKKEEAESIAKDPSAKSRQQRVQQAVIRDLSIEPDKFKQRVETARQERLSRLEAEIQARSGVLTFGLKQAGIIKQSPTKDGNYLVTVPKTEQELAAEREGKDPEAAAAIPTEKEVEMSADELTAFATTIADQETLAHLRDLQSRVMGAAALISSKSESDVQKDIVYAADLQSRAVSIMLRKGNIIDAEVIQAFVDEAAETISGLRRQGMSSELAEAQPSVVPGVSLGTIANLKADFEQRVKDAGGNPANFQTDIFNLTGNTPGRSVILMVKGEVTAERALEDLIENDIRHAIETQPGLLQNLAAALKAVDAEMAELDSDYEPLLPSDTPDYQQIVEAFSHLAAADFALNHGMLPLSEIAHAAIDYSITKLSDLQKLQNIVNAYNAAKAAGRLADTPLEHFLDKARVDMGDIFSAPFNQGMQQALSQVAEAELLREQYAEGNIPTPQPYTHTPAADSITGETLPTPIQEQPDPVNQQTGQYTAPDAAFVSQDTEAGKGLANETCTQEDDGSVRGAAPTAALTPHPDASPLHATDAWNPASAPVHLARRGDGSLLIVSGQPANTTYTPAQVYDVDPATETYWVASHSAAQNILNRTATAQDIQTFFDLNPMTRAQAEAAGMVIKDSQGRPHPQYKTTFAIKPAPPTIPTQRQIINNIYNAGHSRSLLNAVDELQRNGLPKSGLDEHHNFGPLSLRLINDVAAQTNGTVDLSKANHTFAISEIWHAYIGHCLDFFCEENGMNMTYDDLRMMPDILNNYDSVEVFDKSGNLSLRYKKTYGDIEYTLIERIGSKHDYPRDTTQKAIWINDITKKASKAGVSPAARSQGIFARTEIVNPISAFIKQNYKEEAKKIALRMRNKKKGMIAPNGKRSNLPAELYVAVRLQSFKNWFGDWENDPANASKVVDSNGEPMVVYHGSRHAGFVEFDSTLGDVRSNAPEGALFFSSSREVAYSYSGTYEEADLWDADLQQDIEDYGIDDMPPGIYPVFLNIRDPHYIDFKGKNWDDGYFFTLQDESGDYIYPKNGDEFFESEEEAQERAAELGLENYEIYQEYKDTNLVAEEAQDMGADGAIIENVVDEGSYGAGTEATDFVVWDANQVKSATQNNADFSTTDARSTYSLTPLTPEARKSFSVARRSQQFHSILVTAKREASRYSSTYRNASHNAKQAIVESARLSGILQGIAKRIPTAFRPKGLTERIRIHNTLARMLHDGKLSRSSKLNKAFMEALREELATTEDTATEQIQARIQQALNNPADPVRKKVEERLRKELYSKVARQHLDAINKLSTDPSLAPKKRAYERMAESGFIPESMLEEVYEAILDTVAEEAQQKDPENKLTKAGRRKLENELLRKHAKAYAKAQLRDIAFLSEMEKRYRTEEKQNLIHGFARVQADGRIAADSTLPPAAQSSLAHAVEEELAAALPEAIAKELNTTLPEINKELMQEIMSRHIGQELHTVLTGIVDEVADSIDRAYKAHYLGRLQRALDTLKPSKSKSHLAPGKLSHEQYAYIAKLVEYTRLTLPQLEEKQTALQARITELGEKEGESEALMEAQIQHAELTTFGALLQRPADDVVNAVEKFFDIISTGKAEWREKLEAQAARIRSAQNAIKAGVGKVDKDAIAEKERQAASFLGSLKLGLSLKNFFSIPQFLDWLTLIPGMKGKAQSWRTAHARAVQVIRRLELDDIAAEKAFWKSIGIETDLQQATFFESALKRTSTGIYTANKIERRTINIDRQTAQEWLDLTPEQREERRSKLREQGAKPETIVEEEAIPAIAEQLESGNNKKIRLSYKRELPGTSYELKADKMILLNLVLMSERPAYTEHMAEVGFDRATIARIKRYLGKDIRAYGNFMRQYLQRTGMREVYAERTGIKIPDDDFYWPGNFDQSNRLDDAASALEQSLALQGRYGFLKELKEHNLDPTLIMGAHQVFRTALSQHRHYIHLGQLSQDLRRLVHDKDTAAALKTYMGIAGFNSFKAHLDTLDGMPAAQANVTRWLNRIVSVALAARAAILLPANIGTLIKNLSSVINASRGSNMTLAQELRQILKDRFTPEDKLGISLKELWNSDLIQTRFRNISHYEAIRTLGSNGKFSKTSIITRGLFRGIEAFDAAGNVLGAQALYNFTYQQEKEANATREANGEQPLTEEQIHQVCKETVQIMLDIAAQPLSPSQSSALSARDRSALTRSLVFMGSEGINKLANAELAAIHKGADAGFISRLLARAQYLAPYSTFEQMVVMAIALAAGNAPSDDDEEWKWWVGNAIAAATGAGVLQSYPLIGDTLSELTRAITGSKSFMPTGMMAELTGTDLNSLIKIGKDSAVLTKAITDSITGTTDKKSKSAAELTWIILQNLRRIATIAAPFSGYSRIGTTLGDTLTATNAIGNLCRYPVQAWKNAEAAEKKASKRATTRRRGVATKRKGITPTRQK